MNQRNKRGVGVLMLGAGIWLTTFGCGADDDDGPSTAGSHQGGSSTAGTAGRGGSAGSAAGGDTEHGGTAGGDSEHGGAAGSTPGGDTDPGGAAGNTPGGDMDPGGAAGSTVTGGMGGGGAGQGGTPPSDGGQAVGGNTGAGDGGSASAGAPDNGQGGDQATGRVDCGGQSCDQCCYEMLYDEYPFPPSPEFECASVDYWPSFCSFDSRVYMLCDSKSDCSEGEVCCLERSPITPSTYSECSSQCPIAHRTNFHYELCANDEECTAPKQCVKRPDLYFRVCQ